MRSLAHAMWVASALSCGLVASDAGADVRLVPRPKLVSMDHGTTMLRGSWRVRVIGSVGDQVGLAELLGDVRRSFGWTWRAAPQLRSRGEVVIRPCPPFECSQPLAATQGYELRIERDSVVIAAPSVAGRYYGVQTFRQLLRSASATAIPRLHILDYPQFAWRGVSDDISRGQVSTLTDFRETLAHLGYYKCNLYCLYIEDAARFWSAPEVGAARGALTPSELTLICQEATRHHITVMPIFETFGHQERLLSLPAFSAYAELQELPATVKAVSRFAWSCFPAVASALKLPDPEDLAQPATCFSAVSRDGRARVIELIHELAQSTPSPFFHLGGDEPIDLGKGASREAVRRYGVGQVYAAYETALASDVASALHRQPVIFADFLLKEPAALGLIPRDVAVMDWDYDPATVGAGLRRLRDAGFRTIFATAGLWNWFGISPDYARAFPNIARTVTAAVTTRAAGVVTASWGDGGAEALKRANWPGYAFTADASWTGSPGANTFIDRFVATEFGTTSKALSRAEELLAWHTSIGQQYSQRVFNNAPRIRQHSAAWLARMGQLASDMSDARELVSAAGPTVHFNRAGLDVLDHVAARFQYVARRELLMETLAARAAPENRVADHREPYDAVSALGSLRDSSICLTRVYDRLWRRDNRHACLDPLLSRLSSQTHGLDSLIVLARAGRLPTASSGPSMSTSPTTADKFSTDER